MKYLLLLFLLTGCLSKSDKDELRVLAQNFCSCHYGVYYIKYLHNNDVWVNCNDGESQGFDLGDEVNNYCNYRAVK